MVKLRRIVKESEEINSNFSTSSINPLLSTRTIRSIKEAPDGWVELDLSGMNRRNMGFSGFFAGKNPGVYIHKDDLNRLKNSEDIINYKEIVNHSYGSPRNNSITFCPPDNLFTKRVAIPRELVKKLIKYKYLSSIDEYIHLEEMDWIVYSNQGNNTGKSLVIPKAVYERKVSGLDYAEYEATYSSLRKLSNSDIITEKNILGFIDTKQLLLLLRFFYENQNPPEKYDSLLYTELKKEIEGCLDKDNFDSLEDVKIVLSLSDLDLAIHGDMEKQKDALNVFSIIPNIPIYKYTINIYTIDQYRKFISNIMKGNT